MAYRQPSGIPSSVLMASAREAGAEAAKEARLGPCRPCHPALMKTTVCRYFRSRGGRCRRGDMCPYAHGDTDLRQAPDLTKTALCLAFTQGACPCSAEECNFAHGKADKRSLQAAAATAGLGDGRRRARQPWPAGQAQGENAEATRRHGSGGGDRAQQCSVLRIEDLIQFRLRTTSPRERHSGSIGKDVFDDGFDTTSTTDGSNHASSEPSPGGPRARFGTGSSDAGWGATSAFEHEDDAPAGAEREEEPWGSRAGVDGDAPAGDEREEEEPGGSWGGIGGHVPGAVKFKEHGWGAMGGASGTGFSPPNLVVEADGRTFAAYMVPDLRSALLPEELERLLVQAMPSCYSD